VPPTITLTQVAFPVAAAAWLETRRAYISPRTFRDYQDYIDTLTLFFGEMRLPEISADHLRAYQKMRMARAGGRKINQECGIIQQMLKRIGRWDQLVSDYQALPIPKESPGRALSDQEYRRLFEMAASNPAWETAYLFAIISVNTTMGPKEVFTLRMRDVDLDQDLIRVQPEGAKNIHRMRIIPMNPLVRAAIDRLHELAPKRGVTEPDHYLLPYRVSGNSRVGNYDPTRHCTTIKRAWKELTVAADLIGLRPYDLRHTAITTILQDPEVSEETAKSIAGHISARILRTYSHIRIDAKRAALDALMRKSVQSVKNGGNLLKTRERK
jgi:integrase